MLRLMGLVALCVAQAGMAAPQTEFAWDCKFASRQICDASGCKAAPVSGIWIYLTPSHETYSRCEGVGFDKCDDYQAYVSDSGAFKSFELPGRSAFAKVGEDLSVTEVTTIMNTVQINRGKCIVGPPPLVRTR